MYRYGPTCEKDYGPTPMTICIEEETKRNRNFRSALWTGQHLQVTLMSIEPGQSIGLEVHPMTDQFLHIQQGRGLVEMGSSRESLSFRRCAVAGDAVLVPAGTWHNLTNTGRIPLKLFSIYAPPEHPAGTIHRTKEEAEEVESHSAKSLK